MSKHVLTCECGQTLAVDTAQAGETVACGCGKTIAVPTLRQLRELPLAVEESGSAEAAATGTWGVRQGVMAVCLIAAALCLAVAGYSRYSQPEMPQFDATLYTERMDRVVETMTPIDAWRSYVNSYRPLAMVGLQEFRHPAMDALEQEIHRHELVQTAMIGIAAIALVTAGALGAMGRGD
jgi:hypothetical protein